MSFNKDWSCKECEKCRAERQKEKNNENKENDVIEDNVKLNFIPKNVM